MFCFYCARVACNFNCFIETGGLLRVTWRHYTGNVVISRKRWDIYSDVVTTDHYEVIYYRITYWIVAIPTTFKITHRLQPFSNVIFVRLCSSWQHFNRHSASRGPSAIADLLVNVNSRHNLWCRLFRAAVNTVTTEYRPWVVGCVSWIQSERTNNIDATQLVNITAMTTMLKVWLTTTAWRSCLCSVCIKSRLRRWIFVIIVRDSQQSPMSHSRPITGWSINGQRWSFCCCSWWYSQLPSTLGVHGRIINW